jgi:monoamine oxidase
VGAGPHTWERALAALRPDLDLVTADALLTDWHEDPWTRGGYSHVLTGRDRSADDVLHRPAGPFVIAGEYTAGRDAGTMEGALASGVRAARVVTASAPPH